ncbi:MAG: NAD-dependent epimerase/dehydratase family protein [Gemmatimonadaceae bacterium]
MPPLPPICLTGATGFIGRRVLARLADLSATDVTLLLRDPSRLAPRASNLPSRLVQIDLGRESIPAGSIAPDSVVIHLAAATGTAAASQMQQVNIAGTQRLLDAAQAAGAGHILFVSSVAAGYRDQRWALYAKSKVAAERLIAAGSIPYTIVRPTIVFGPGSPNQRGLERLAALALPLLPGQGDVRVQPIHVDDLAEALLRIASGPPVGGAAVTIGGPTVATMRALFAAIRRARGLAPREPLRLPLEPLRRVLAITGSLLPVRAGQFVVFANDSMAEPPPARVRLPIPRVSLEAMLTPVQQGASNQAS